MCTISWFVDEHSYHIFFNRDEDLNRPKAQVPEIVQQASVRCLMPIDPQGRGTWLSVNEYGYTYALLNYYQGRLPKGRLRSRGQIVKDISSCHTLDSAERYLQQLNLVQYAPFSLLIFSPDLIEQNSGATRPAIMFRWSGKEWSREKQISPLFSSAIDFAQVSDSRMRIYTQFISPQESLSCENFRALHASHLPEKSRSSICMHREDAKTVSMSQVSYSKNEVIFRYIDGSPCEAGPETCVQLNTATR